VAAPCSQWIACSPVRNGIVPGRSTRSLDVMRNNGDDALDVDPGHIVISFIAAMNEWEIETATGHRRAREAGEGAAFDYNVARLREIFERFCTARERPWGRLSAPSFGRPPEYNPSTETITEVAVKSAEAVVVETLRNTPLGGSRRYTLHRSGGTWRIDNIMRLSGDKWERATL
jgi:NTF2 fold immunity protein